MSVIKVLRPDPGFVPIPNSFAEDLRLSESAVAVGLYLASRWDGFRIRPVDIQAQFSKRPGKPRGREWWARVAAELKAANYMALNRTHSADGKFASDWIFCVLGLPSEGHTSGSADVGSAGIGSPDGGAAISGKASTYIQEGFSQEETTTTTSTSEHLGGCGLDALKGLVFENSIARQKDLLSKLLKGLSLEDAQGILDEVAAVVEEAARGRRPVINDLRGYVEKLVRSARNNDFHLNKGLAVQKRRSEQMKPLPTATPVTRPSEVGKNALMDLKSKGTRSGNLVRPQRLGLSGRGSG